MPARINLKELFGSDSQGVTVDKLNFNFNKMLELGIGTPGPSGTTGGVGGLGPDGPPGGLGTRGSLWYTGSGLPIAGTTGGAGILANDLYVNGDTGDQYKWNGTIWTLVTDIGGNITSAISTATGIAFTRGLRLTGSMEDKIITFKNTNAANADGIGNSSADNDMLFLNNFDEGSLTLNPEDLYTSFIKILPDDTGTVLRRFPIDIGTYYNSSNAGNSVSPSEDIVTKLKHNLKFRHAVKYIDGEYLYIGRTILSRPEEDPIGGNDFNSILEYRTSKWDGTTADEMHTRIGSIKGLSKYWNDVSVDGVSVTYNGGSKPVAAFGIAKDFLGKIGEDYAAIEGSVDLAGILLNDKTFQRGGDIIQEGNTTNVLTGVDVANQPITGGSTKWFEQSYLSSGMVVHGDSIYIVDGSSGDITETASGSNLFTSEKGRISEVDVSNPNSPELIRTEEQGYSLSNFIGGFLSDVAISGDHLYVVNRVNSISYDSISTFNPITFQSIKINNRSDNTPFKMVGTLYSPDLFDAYRIKIKGCKAYIGTNGMRRWGPGGAVGSPSNNFFGSKHGVYEIDITDPSKPSITLSSIAEGQNIIDLDIIGNHVVALHTDFSSATATTLNNDIRLSLYDISDDLKQLIQHNIASSTTNITSTNHNDGTDILIKSGAVTTNGRHVFTSYRNSLFIHDYKKISTTSSMPTTKSFTIGTGYAMDIKVIGDDLYILMTSSPDGLGSSSILKYKISKTLLATTPTPEWSSDLTAPGCERLVVVKDKIFAYTTNDSSKTKLIPIDIDAIHAGNAVIGNVNAGDINITKDITVGANAHVNGELNAASIKVDHICAADMIAKNLSIPGSGDVVSVPVGGIIMYTGNEVPGNGLLWNYRSCNGGNVFDNSGTVKKATRPDGTLVPITEFAAFPWASSGNPMTAYFPDLTDRFPLGSSNQAQNAEKNGSFEIAEGNLPAHSHDKGDLHIPTPNYPKYQQTDYGAHEHFGTVGHTASSSASVRLSWREQQATAYEYNGFCDGDQYGATNECDGVSIMQHEGSGHGHSNDAFAGETGNTGSGQDYYQPYTRVEYIIRIV